MNVLTRVGELLKVILKEGGAVTICEEGLAVLQGDPQRFDSASSCRHTFLHFDQLQTDPMLELVPQNFRNFVPLECLWVLVL